MMMMVSAAARSSRWHVNFAAAFGIATAAIVVNPFAATAAHADAICHGKQNGSLCSDGNACTTGDTCTNNTCVGTAKPLPDDSNLCTVAICNRTTGAVTQMPLRGQSCTDNNRCTTDDKCDSTAKCVGKKFDPALFDDGNPCTVTVCTPSTGKFSQLPFVGPACNDKNACTTNDTCSAAGCAGSPIAVDDGDACTTDSCDPVLGVAHLPLACAPGSSCKAGSCVPTDPCAGKAIDDGNACTVDSCSNGAVTHIADAACEAAKPFQFCADGSAPTLAPIGTLTPDNQWDLDNLQGLSLNATQLTWVMPSGSAVTSFMVAGNGFSSVNAFGTPKASAYQFINNSANTWQTPAALKPSPGATYAYAASKSRNYRATINTTNHTLAALDRVGAGTLSIIALPPSPVSVATSGTFMFSAGEFLLFPSPQTGRVSSLSDYDGNLGWPSWILNDFANHTVVHTYRDATGVTLLTTKPGNAWATYHLPEADNNTPVSAQPLTSPGITGKVHSVVHGDTVELLVSPTPTSSTPAAYSSDGGQTWTSIPDPDIGEQWQTEHPPGSLITRRSLHRTVTVVKQRFVATFGKHLYALNPSTQSWQPLSDLDLPIDTFDITNAYGTKQTVTGDLEPCAVRIDGFGDRLMITATQQGGCRLPIDSFTAKTGFTNNGTWGSYTGNFFSADAVFATEDVGLYELICPKPPTNDGK